MPRKRELPGFDGTIQVHGTFLYSRSTFVDDETMFQQRNGSTVAHSETRPATALAALMECAPGQDPDLSLEELSPLRDILADAVDGLSERDRWIVDSLVTARLSLRQVAEQLSLSKTQVARLRDEALAKLRLALQSNPTIMEHLR
jgi:RNA polymerase sigma factor (sigma-70 family)